jgi:hypothetical protein
MDNRMKLYRIEIPNRTVFASCSDNPEPTIIYRLAQDEIMASIGLGDVYVDEVQDSISAVLGFADDGHPAYKTQLVTSDIIPHVTYRQQA